MVIDMRYWFVNILSRFPQLDVLVLKTRVFRRHFNQAELGTISPVFAHAMSTSVTVLLNNIEEVILQKDSFNATKLEGSYQAALKLKQLLSLNSQPPKGWINLKDSLDHVAIIFKAKHNLTAFCYYPELDILIRGNKIAVEEAILCLLNNAAESYSKSSKTRVVILCGLIRKRSVQLIIEDFGTGMNFIAQKVAIMSGISYKKQGLGLGLSYAIHIIQKQLGGKIDFESKLNKGTKLIITFPLRNSKRNRNL